MDSANKMYSLHIKTLCNFLIYFLVHLLQFRVSACYDCTGSFIDYFQRVWICAGHLLIIQLHSLLQVQYNYQSLLWTVHQCDHHTTKTDSRPVEVNNEICHTLATNILKMDKSTRRLLNFLLYNKYILFAQIEKNAL